MKKKLPGVCTFTTPNYIIPIAAITTNQPKNIQDKKKQKEGGKSWAGK